MIYLDHAATTPVLPSVLNEMLYWMQPEHVGNPGSVHSQGRSAQQAVARARQQLADLIRAEPEEIIFTSGASESNTLWHRLVEKRFEASEYDIILYSATSHHSVTNSSYPISSAPIRYSYYDGCVDLDWIREKIEDYEKIGTRVKAISVEWVNNETGAINPIRKIAEIAHDHDIILHVDASQAVGHIPIDVADIYIDFMTISGHKFGGPMGVGALYVNRNWKRKLLTPDISGGGQEFGLRAGTENVPGIVGLGKAAEIAMRRMQIWIKHWHHLRRVFSLAIFPDIGTSFQISSPLYYVPNIISLTIPGINSEALLLMLDTKGVCISAGSACAAHGTEPSHVLLAMGMSREDAACTVRISMGVSTTEQEMRDAVAAIVDAVKILKKMDQ